jgi:hypothetical protein
MSSKREGEKWERRSSYNRRLNTLSELSRRELFRARDTDSAQHIQQRLFAIPQTAYTHKER